MSSEETYLEIFCPSCEYKNLITFDESFVDHTVNCIKCNTNIYWHSCPECETGWHEIPALNLTACPECGYS